MSEFEPGILVPAITGIVGAFVGAVSTGIPALITEWLNRRRERAQLEASLLAEVAALVEIADSRSYLKGLKTVRDLLKQQPSHTTYSYSVRIPEHYSRIYQENANRIGLIDSATAKKIVQFHHFIDAVVQDVTPGGSLSAGSEIKGFDEAAEILRKALEIGRQLGISARRTRCHTSPIA